MKLPHCIIVRVLDTNSAPVADIIVQLTVWAGRKNPFRIVLPKTGSTGMTEISNSDFVGQFQDHFEQGLMDYDGSIDSANPNVILQLFNPSGLLTHKETILLWPLLPYERTKWTSRAEKVRYLLSCRNLEYESDPVMVNLEVAYSFVFQVSRRNHGTSHREGYEAMAEAYADRFQPERYAHEEPVAVRWRNKIWSIPISLFARIQFLAQAYQLHLLPALEIYATSRLNTQQVATLLEELIFIRGLVDDPALRPHLDSWIVVAQACVRDVNKDGMELDGP